MTRKKTKQAEPIETTSEAITEIDDTNLDVDAHDLEWAKNLDIKTVKPNPIAVSVLMRIRNGISGYPQGSMERAIRSAFDQPSINVEVIAVNNGSTDDTAAVLSSLRDEYPFLKVVTLEENVGEAEALNIACENASGRCCIQLTARSYFGQDALKDLYNPIVDRKDNHNEDVFACGGMRVTSDVPNVARYHRPPPFNKKDYSQSFKANFFMFPRSVFEDGLRAVDYIKHGTPEGVGIWDRDFMMQMIWDKGMRCIPLPNIHVVTYEYSGSNQMSTRVQQNRPEIDRIFRERWGKYL